MTLANDEAKICLFVEILGTVGDSGAQGNDRLGPELSTVLNYYNIGGLLVHRALFFRIFAK